MGEAALLAMQIKTMQQQIALIAQVVDGMALTEFLNQVDLADTLGSMLHPTEWMEAEVSMHEWEKLARSLREFRTIVRRIFKHQQEGVLDDNLSE